MGANQSTRGNDARDNRGAGGNPDERGVRRCYYEVLGIGRSASEDKIRKSYRKKALELHPDRNYGNVEETTKLFAEVRAAYEVLSDPQERAWYDSHRVDILRGNDDTRHDYEHDVRMTAASDLIRLLASLNSQMGASGPTEAFYTKLRETFLTLGREETLACEWQDIDTLNYPGFGTSNDSWEFVARPFYAAWSGFSTKKSFAWKDIYRYHDAPDRRVRRAMEKENRRFRDEGIREFNDAVRSLVAFAKKRDLRFQFNAQTVIQRQKTLQDAARAQAERSRAANQARLKEFQETSLPAWTQTTSASDEEADRLTEDEDEDEDQVVEHLHCVVCGKTFKSENQYEAHERSKKHVKAMQELCKRMRKEDKSIFVDGGFTSRKTEGCSAGDDKSNASQERLGLADQDKDSVGSGSDASVLDTPLPLGSKVSVTLTIPTTLPTSSCEDDSYARRELLEERVLGNHKDEALATGMGGLRLTTSARDLEPDEHAGSKEHPVKPKPGKAKKKRLRKIAQKENGIGPGKGDLECATCGRKFDSKTELFDHIKRLDHAQPMPSAAKGRQKRRGL